MIDTHVHVVSPNLPGAGSLHPVLGCSVETVAATFRAEMQSAGLSTALAFGCLSTNESDPLGIAQTLQIAQQVPGLYVVGAADPRRTEKDDLARCAQALASGQVRALKGYLGYLPFGPDHPGYRSYYELCSQYQVPFIFHTGDTYSARAKLRYAQPLLVDEVAVDYPRVNFVLAHVGNPWLLDAAEVVYKNINVWTDVSGFVIGPESVYQEADNQERLHEAGQQLQKAFRYAERPNRFLFGSDWPLTPLEPYKNYIAGLFPEMYHSLLFEENAQHLFKV